MVMGFPEGPVKECTKRSDSSALKLEREPAARWGREGGEVGADSEGIVDEAGLLAALSGYGRIEGRAAPVVMITTSSASLVQCSKEVLESLLVVRPEQWLIMFTAGRNGTSPNLPYNNVSELLGLLIHKWCELYHFYRESISIFSLKFTTMPALLIHLRKAHRACTGCRL
jgi:hypothetical protein